MTIWKALKARLTQEPPLTPGTCECEHIRSVHRKGKYRCCVQYPPHTEDNDSDVWTSCACEIFIPEKGGGGNEPIPDPSPEEVEKEIARYERV